MNGLVDPDTVDPTIDPMIRLVRRIGSSGSQHPSTSCVKSLAGPRLVDSASDAPSSPSPATGVDDMGSAADAEFKRARCIQNVKSATRAPITQTRPPKVDYIITDLERSAGVRGDELSSGARAIARVPWVYLARTCRLALVTVGGVRGYGAWGRWERACGEDAPPLSGDVRRAMQPHQALAAAPAGEMASECADDEEARAVRAHVHAHVIILPRGRADGDVDVPIFFFFFLSLDGRLSVVRAVAMGRVCAAQTRDWAGETCGQVGARVHGRDLLVLTCDTAGGDSAAGAQPGDVMMTGRPGTGGQDVRGGAAYRAFVASAAAGCEAPGAASCELRRRVHVQALGANEDETTRGGFWRAGLRVPPRGARARGCGGPARGERMRVRLGDECLCLCGLRRTARVVDAPCGVLLVCLVVMDDGVELRAGGCTSCVSTVLLVRWRWSDDDAGTIMARYISGREATYDGKPAMTGGVAVSRASAASFGYPLLATPQLHLRLAFPDPLPRVDSPRSWTTFVGVDAVKLTGREGASSRLEMEDRGARARSHKEPAGGRVLTVGTGAGAVERGTDCHWREWDGQRADARRATRWTDGVHTTPKSALELRLAHALTPCAAEAGMCLSVWQAVLLGVTLEFNVCSMGNAVAAFVRFVVRSRNPALFLPVFS
ncbi:hypothetical protein DFH06DRAFT_1123918 [Mycena polygramma]|nr:hypothetical protein DFH06DRAFT_1123918 [Mycena polygramma]